MRNVYKKGPIITILFLFLMISFVIVINYNESLLKKENNNYELENNYSDILISDNILTKNFNISYDNKTDINSNYKLIMYLNDMNKVVDKNTKFEIISSDSGAINHYGPLYPYGINYNEIIIGEGYFVPGINTHNYIVNIDTDDKSLINYIDFKIELE